MRADELMKKRRDRAIAIILGVKEREVDPLLSQEPGGRLASQKLRKVVLDQLNDFYDLALDVAASGEAPNFEFNPDVWSRRIEGHLRGLSESMAELAESTRVGNGHG